MSSIGNEETFLKSSSRKHSSHHDVSKGVINYPQESLQDTLDDVSYLRNAQFQRQGQCMAHRASSQPKPGTQKGVHTVNQHRRLCATSF